ncbi:hypothetical protein TTHERM_00621310 (macronuclear) [Tetrahymena thermophila SB210]|uniref:Uncharacterized protein n=1 Tax=Tetrahymena thermophila (strain SB210) TaxID=312017 RepID=Q23MC8_TETTS|nr:hypothetical protein TTHERM_00621310 [Tetrahymena thermophila SB210]EAR97711.2 hypothetical protein TTHERM_00621310 [Tetrahymena thermophila SB210]|eukprot:XP_001017956.2 hypothetical protein TTHERM_00621310 [Tetrahymena thermophila SB210]
MQGTHQVSGNQNIAVSQQNYTLETNMSINNPPSVIQPDNLERKLPERGVTSNYQQQQNLVQSNMALQLVGQDDQYEYNRNPNSANKDQRFQQSSTQSILNKQPQQGGINQSRAAPIRNDTNFNSQVGFQGADLNNKQKSSALPLSNVSMNDYKSQGNQNLFPLNLNQRPETNHVIKTHPSYRQEQIFSQTEKTQYLDNEPGITAIEPDRPSHAPIQNQYYNTVPSQHQQMNRVPANPQADARYANDILAANISPSGQKKFPHKIFDNPPISYRGTHQRVYAGQQRQGEEQMIMGPNEMNRTIQNDENITIYDNNNHPFEQGQEFKYQTPGQGKSFHSNYPGYAQNQYNSTQQGVFGHPSQALAQTNQQGIVQTQHPGYIKNMNYLYQMVPNGKYPPLIYPFMTSDLNLDKETDQLYFRPIEQNIPVILVTLKARVEGKLDLCNEILHVMEQESQYLRKNCEEVQRKFLQTEHICKVEYVSIEDDFEQMQIAIQNINEQMGTIESLQNHIAKQLIQSEPESIRMPIIQDLVLNEYIKQTKLSLEDFKQPFTSNFDNNYLNMIETKNLPQILTDLSKYNKKDRVVMLKSKAQEENNQQLEYIYSFIKHLYDCEALLFNISTEVESALFRYAEFLMDIQKKLVATYTYLNCFINVLNLNITQYQDINQYQHNYEMILNSSKNITDALLGDVKFRYNDYFEQNEKLLNEIEYEKQQLSKSLIEYNLYIRDMLQKGIQMQQKENTPFFIQTPLSRLVVQESHQVDKYKKRLELMDSVIKAFRSLRYTTSQAKEFEQQVDVWYKAQQTKYPTEDQMKEKIQELQAIIIKLIDMRDNLGLHHLQNSHVYLYKEVMEEYEYLSKIIDKIQNIQIEISKQLNQQNLLKGDNNVLVVGQKSQKQIIQLNSVVQGGQINNLPILQEQDDRVKRSRYSPKKYHDDVDRFNYEVNKTRHLLQQNAQRIDLTVMERSKCLDMHEELTNAQTRFQIFVVKTRIEQLINPNKIKQVISSLFLVEELKKKKEKDSDIFEINNELDSLKTQLQSFLSPNENQNNTYQKLLIIKNVISDLAQNYQKLTASFFDAQNCKEMIEQGFTPLHQTMQVFRESCQKHLKSNSKSKVFKQEEIDQISEIIDQYIKNNTNQFIKKSQELEINKDVDISYSHMLFLQQQLSLNLEDVLQLIDEKQRVGVELKVKISAEDYLKQNGINLQKQRDNIEKRKENLKTITSVKGIKNKETLEEVALHIKADEKQLDVVLQTVQNLIMIKLDVQEKLLEQLTFPPSFNIPEGKEVQHLIKFTENLKLQIEKAIDDYEDPLDVPVTTMMTTEGDEPKSEERNFNFSVFEKFPEDKQNENDKVLKSNKNPPEQRLLIIKQSVTKSMKAICKYLDYMIKQLEQQQQQEQKYLQTYNNAIIIMDKVGRKSFLELCDFINNLKTNFDSFCTGLIKVIPYQLKFLVNLIQASKEKYLHFVHEVIIRKYQKENILNLGVLIQKIEDSFDLNYLVNLILENVSRNYTKTEAQVVEHVELIKQCFNYAEEQVSQIEDILDEIHKLIGGAQSNQNLNILLSEIADEDLMYFWQRYFNQVNDFYKTYYDIKKKKIITEDESEIKMIFQQKINNLLVSVQGQTRKVAQEISDKYIQIIANDYNFYMQSLKLDIQHQRSKSKIK